MGNPALALRAQGQIGDRYLTAGRSQACIPFLCTRLSRSSDFRELSDPAGRMMPTISGRIVGCWRNGRSRGFGLHGIDQG